VTGAITFARFAYPPNALGYCGPDEHDTLLECADAGIDDGCLRFLARSFEGAWPYLELIASANAIADPLDTRVVEAYWLGNGLLRAVTPDLLHRSLEDRFRSAAGRQWERLAAVVPYALAPQHGFHVFAVYPWTGLLRGPAQVDALHVLDRCRIRWGRVRAVDGDAALVDSARLTWDGRRLALGPERAEQVVVARNGAHLAPGCRPGDVVALHWEWVCERLDERRLRWLQRCTRVQLRAVNAMAFSPPAAVLS